MMTPSSALLLLTLSFLTFLLAIPLFRSTLLVSSKQGVRDCATSPSYNQAPGVDMTRAGSSPQVDKGIIALWMVE